MPKKPERCEICHRAFYKDEKTFYINLVAPRKDYFQNMRVVPTGFKTKGIVYAWSPNALTICCESCFKQVVTFMEKLESEVKE